MARLPDPRRAAQQNAEFWSEKIARNQARDRLVSRTLRRAGWRVMRIWDEVRQHVDGRTKCGPEVKRKGERKRVPIGRLCSQHEPTRKYERRLLARLRRAGLLHAGMPNRAVQMKL